MAERAHCSRCQRYLDREGRCECDKKLEAAEARAESLEAQLTRVRKALDDANALELWDGETQQQLVDDLNAALDTPAPSGGETPEEKILRAIDDPEVHGNQSSSQ